MTTILIEKQYFDWSQILSDNICKQMKEVHQTQKFFFTSYVIWVAARAGKFMGLQVEGQLGDEEGQKKVWEYYSRLPLVNAKAHFKRINDAFIFPIIIKLIGDTGYRIIPEAMAIIREWACWFIQNPHSTYIRVSGFIGNPMLLPKYCNDRIILLEYVRQLLGLESLLSSKFKIGIDFLVYIGYFLCSKIQVAKLAEPELQDLNLKE